jgi:DNA-binding transcriptional MocR family regulator
MEQYTDLRASSASELAERLESMVLSGVLEQGERLPTIRRLADSLRLAPNTVASAYRTLAMRGTVISDGRRGTRVARRRSPSPAPPVPEGLVDLASGNPDPSLLPDLTGRLDAAGPVHVLYGDDPVDSRLAEVMLPRIADLVGARSMVVVGGALDGVERALQAHLHPGDAVAVEDPGWTAFTDLLTAMGLRPVPVPVDEYGMVPERLDRVVESVRAVVMTPRVQNPTGAAIDARRRAELVGTVARHPELFVVEDDHGGLIAGVPLESVGAGRRRWAYVQSVSKSLGPDLRLAVMAGDEVTTGRVLARQSAGTGWVSHILQRLTAAVLSDPATQGILEKASQSYRTRREELIGALGVHGIDAVGRTGLNVWVPIPDEAAVVGALARAGYAVAPGQGFRVATPPGVRISVGRLVPGMAEQVAAVVAGAIGGRSGGRFA